ncbi:hypothetical protein EC991_007988 [Linnemannia zychae]|nr:hypothetical protein EC991_007988 [Linnemannia zychae]
MTVSINIEGGFHPPLAPYQQQLSPRWHKRIFTRRLAKRCLLVLISLTALFLVTDLYHTDRSKQPASWQSPLTSSDASPSEPSPEKVFKASPINPKDFLSGINRTRLQEIAKNTKVEKSPKFDPIPLFFDEPETLPPNGQRRPGARIIDVIPVNDELDMLEVRMEELDSVVDLFVILESERTFMMKNKPLYFRKNKDRFKKFAHKTIALYIPEMEWSDRHRILTQKLYDITWAPEVYERSFGMRVALKESQARTGDWIIYSDLDEIPRKDVIAALRGVDSENPEDRSYCSGSYWSGAEQTLKVLPQGKDVYRLNCAYYQFSYEYLFEKKKWNGPVVFRYFKQNETVYDDFIALSNPSTPGEGEHQIDLATTPAKRRPTAAEVFENFKDKDLAYYENWVRAANRTSQEIKMYKQTMKNLWIDGGFKTRWLRDNVDFPLLDQACWHCTYCQANISQILYKLRSSSHREYNRNDVSNKAWILDRVSTGQDLIDRPDHELVYIPNNMDVPEFVNQDREKYKYVLDVHGTPNAGFLDVDPNNPL